MKIKQGFMLRQIVGTWLVVPVGEKVVDFNGMFTLSDSGAFLWKLLEENKNKEELLAFLLDEYDIDRETAEADIECFMAQLEECNILE
ncbi:MAG: PqqD family protein [Oscillospiraceae bacterium]|nr:PqqD family protein [Oscillospiraceae bacterium]